MSNIVEKGDDEILEQIMNMFRVLSLPEWVGDAFKAGILCGAYNDNPPVSGVIENGSKEDIDIQNIVAEIQKSQPDEKNLEIPYYAVINAQENSTGYFVLTVPSYTDEYGEKWEQQVKDAGDGKVTVYFGENGKLASPEAIPMKVVLMPFFADGEDRSCIKLELFSDEEYKNMGYNID